MGSKKQEALERQSTRRLSPYERAQKRYDDLRGHLAREVSNLVGAVEDDFRPNTRLQFIRRDDGGYLAIIKRDNDLINEVMIAYGEDLWVALLAINKKLAASEWQVDTPYTDESDT